MIDFKRKIVFIHPIKTGGSSIEAALLHPSLGLHEYNGQRKENINKYNLKKHFPPNGNPHENYKETIKGYDFTNFTFFTIARNPWDRFASMYRYHKKLGLAKGSFEDYVSTKWFLFSNNTFNNIIGKDIVNFIVLKQETLQSDFSAMLIGLGLEDVELPFVNVTSEKDNKKKYRCLLDNYPELIERIRMESKMEIELGGYVY